MFSKIWIFGISLDRTNCKKGFVDGNFDRAVRRSWGTGDGKIKLNDLKLLYYRISSVLAAFLLATRRREPTC
jgi:hypothetical protein